ncbi:MAG: hypothetical protein GF308_18085 [Candidatus Heimdallarchaeota archaeon]|nr:hypothetical protein [Candidatus Heimdallarchaeota archaeon]
MDANIYLGTVLPNHPWKNFVDKMVENLKNNSTKYKTFITANLRKEVYAILDEKTDFILERFRSIIQNFSDFSGNFTHEDLTELNSQFNAEIALLNESREEKHKLLLF